MAAARRQPTADRLWYTLRHVAALDSTFLRLSAKQSPWSVHKGVTPGARLQCSLDLATQIPDPFRLTISDGDVLLADDTVTLGSPNNRRGTVLSRMRVVISRNRDQAVHAFLTDRHDLTATEVVQLYRKRWQIELFFRWRKHQLGVIHPLGQSRAAVWLTLLMAIIVVLLMTLLEADRPPRMSRVSWAQATASILLLAIMDG